MTIYFKIISGIPACQYENQDVGFRIQGIGKEKFTVCSWRFTVREEILRFAQDDEVAGVRRFTAEVADDAENIFKTLIYTDEHE